MIRRIAHKILASVRFQVMGLLADDSITSTTGGCPCPVDHTEPAADQAGADRRIGEHAEAALLIAGPLSVSQLAAIATEAYRRQQATARQGVRR